MRYQKQILLTNIGKKGQSALKKSTVTIVGLGAIGTNSAELLARAGIGNLVLIDRDIIELDNLQRQTLFNENDIGKAKAIQASLVLKKINSEITIKPTVADLNHKNINSLIDSNIILDCTDNIETRFLINEYCLYKRIPWIYSGVIENKSVLFTIIPKKTPCFNCIFNNASPIDTCETSGILNAAASLAASLQVSEAINFLINKRYTKELIYFDIWKKEINKIKVKKNKTCNACKNNFNYINGKIATSLIKLCGKNTFQITGEKKDLNEIKEKLSRIGKVNINKYMLSFKNIILFNDGRALIKTDSAEKAKSIYSKYIGN